MNLSKGQVYWKFEVQRRAENLCPACNPSRPTCCLGEKFAMA